MEIWMQKIHRGKNILLPKWKCGFVGGIVRLLVPCPGLVCGDGAIKQGRRYYGATNMVVMIMRMVMMAIWTGMWGPGHKARRQIHTEVNQTRVNMALKVSLYWPTGHP